VNQRRRARINSYHNPTKRRSLTGRGATDVQRRAVASARHRANGAKPSTPVIAELGMRSRHTSSTGAQGKHGRNTRFRARPGSARQPPTAITSSTKRGTIAPEASHTKPRDTHRPAYFTWAENINAIMTPSRSGGNFSNSNYQIRSARAQPSGIQIPQAALCSAPSHGSLPHQRAEHACQLAVPTSHPREHSVPNWATRTVRTRQGLTSHRSSFTRQRTGRSGRPRAIAPPAYYVNPAARTRTENVASGRLDG
jgi:hypothetical protein